VGTLTLLNTPGEFKFQTTVGHQGLQTAWLDLEKLMGGDIDEGMENLG
jgi:hypothetical protein